MANAMTPREILKRCIHFQDPPRAGMYFARFGMDDMVNILEFFDKDEHGADPWGIIYTVHPEVPSIGITKEGMVQNERDMDNIHSPNP